MSSERGARLALAAFIAATLVVHGVVAWWSPLQGDDWQHVLWSGSGSGSWLAGHLQLGDAWGYLVTRSTLFHTIVSPVVGVILVLGVFTLSARRLPDPGRWCDVLGVALVSCMIWIALPRAGVMWFHRSYAAAQIYGAALVVWFLVPFRCRWQRDGAAWRVAMFVAGLAVGATTRQLGLAAVIGAGIAVRRTRRSARPTWMVPGLAGAAISFVAGFARWQLSDLVFVFGHPERSLTRMAPILQAGGQLVAPVALVAIARLVRSSDRCAVTAAPTAREPAQDVGRGSQPPDAGDSLAWLAAWLGLGLAALLGPRSTAATQLPSALALCAGVLPYLSWLAGARLVRWVLACVAVGVHLVAWTLALSTYAALDTEFCARMAAVARTPAGQIATVRPYSDLLPTFWSIGEDWADLGLRSTLARERWNLAGIDLAPPFRRLERSPDLALALEVEDVSRDQLAAAGSPPRWPREIGPARGQFAALIERLRAITGRGVTARLRAVDLDFAARRARPILVAWSDGAAAVAPEVARSRPDDTGRTVIAVAPSLAAGLDEAWLVGPWGADATHCAAGRCVVAEQRAERTVLVLCGAERCLAVDAWVPQL
jgi:hypothetical protein